MQLTDEQGEVREGVATLRNGENLKVLAFAGAGKTTTLKACAEARRDRGVYLAFNRGIAAEAKQKLATTKCQAYTMHGLGYALFKNQGIFEQPADVNVRTVMNADILGQFHFPEVKGWGEFRIASAVLRTMKSFASSADEDFDVSHADAALIESLGDPEFISNEEKSAFVRDTMEKLADPLHLAAQSLWVKLMEDGQFSFDMYVKMIDIDDGLRRDAFSRFKYIMVDEAQDNNPVLTSILSKTGLPLVAVGDPYQQLYSWRGAENALQQLPGRELHLTQSFRFGENIAVVARKILDSIPDGGGPEQRLQGCGPGKIAEKPQGAVICRTNVGMLDEAVKYLNKGYAVYVDNIKDLERDVRSAQALRDGRMNDVESAELKPFDTWEELEMTAEESADPGLSKLVNLVRTNRIGDVNRVADAQKKSSETSSLVVYTGHRSKGLEFDAVQLGDDWPDMDVMMSRYKTAKMMSDKHVTSAKEAFNTLYVATTRAKLRCKGYGKILQPAAEQTGPMTQEEAAAAVRGMRPGEDAYEPS